MKNIYKERNRGFTIIEMMIAISIFVIVIMIGMGALFNTNLVFNKSKNMRSIMDSLSFIMEDMSKNIRTGYSYECRDDLSLSAPISCTNGHIFAFEAFDVANNSYYQKIYQIDSYGKIGRSIQPVGSANSFTQLNSDDVIIDYDKSGFSVLGAEPFPGDKQQPLVIIRLAGNISYKGVLTPFSLQTSVSQRSSDI